MGLELELQLQTKQTDSGLYQVTYARPDAPLDVQEVAFTANRLDTVSPAVLGFLRVNVSDGIFDRYSRTKGRVIHDVRDGGKGFVVFPEGLGTLVRTADIVRAHRRGNEYVIPKDQQDLCYDLIDDAIKNGAAVCVGYDKIDVPTHRFGEDKLTSILYAEPSLGAKAQDYGNHVAKMGRTEQSFFFDNQEYAMANGLYVNGLRLYGSDLSFFYVLGNYRNLGSSGGAFGVRLEKVAEGAQKI